MSDLSRILLPSLISIVLVAAVVLLGRRPQKQFAWGSVVIFLAALIHSIAFPSLTTSSGGFWSEGYTTAFATVAALYAIAQVAIWRGFSRPGWLALLLTLPFAIFLASMGLWEAIV
jgi:hypothetical protein